MKILEPSFEIWQQESGLLGIYKQIEKAGRVCYKSEQNVSEGSAKPFVERMITAEHTAMLEHGTVYMTVKEGEQSDYYVRNRFSHVNIIGHTAYITTNLRVLAENKRMADLELLTELSEHHERRVTVHFTTQVAVTREFNRHRANSMAEQSTRYCNYGKNKFGGEITVNLPEWVKNEPDYSQIPQTSGTDQLKRLCKDMITAGETKAWNAFDNWLFANLACELAYLNLISLGKKPQEARAVLPLDVNTELVHTAFVSDWKHFFDLRAIGTTGAPHPDAKAIAQPLYEEFERLGLL